MVVLFSCGEFKSRYYFTYTEFYTCPSSLYDSEQMLRVYYIADTTGILQNKITYWLTHSEYDFSCLWTSLREPVGLDGRSCW